MIYFDMDGVLFRFDFDGYTGKPVPEFKKLGSHYFLHREPVSVALQLFKYCLEAFPLDTYVLTSVCAEPEIRHEQVIDKIESLYRVAPEFDIGSHFIACAGDKRNNIIAIREMSLTHRDVLIDDYNPNLYKWIWSGGSAIKFLNGVNSHKSWHSYTLHCTSDHIVEDFQVVLSKVCGS